ncbi:MAG: transcriptional regulator FtrA [Actinobacteria bacterium]|nr:transcriptional regulator FtrA [Actinomycetota bacterium]
MALNRRVVAVVYDSLCAFEFGLTTELFGLARPELDVDWYDFEVVSVDGPNIGMAGGVSMTAPTDLLRIESAGTVVLPGWSDPSEQPPAELIAAIIGAHRNGARIMSVCSGVFVLAATGLLDGMRATTHWRYALALQAAYPMIDVRPDVLYVDNGALLTSAGSAAGIDLGLHLIQRDFGQDIANRVARRLVLPPHRDGGQAQFINQPVPADSSSSVAPTIDWALERLAEPLTVNEMAAHANMSSRTFARRFRDDVGLAPLQWLNRQRVLYAKRLLETGTASIDIVARQAGFGSAANFRHHFEREARTTPTRYRSSFAAE